MTSKAFFIDFENKVITRPDSRWYETMDGCFASSTTKLGIYAKPGLQIYKINLAKLGIDEKKESIKNMDEGSSVHDLSEKYDRGELVTLYNENEDQLYDFWGVWIPFLRYIEFTKEYNVEPVLIEQSVWSKKHKYAGTLDRLCFITPPKGKRQLAIIDLKRSASGSPDYHWQVASYKKALEEMFYNNDNPGLNEFKGLIKHGLQGAELNSSVPYLLLLNTDTKKGWRLTEIKDIDIKYDMFLDCSRLWDKLYPNYNFMLKQYPIEVCKNKPEEL